MTEEAEPSRYCRKCFYPLNKLAGQCCPECGRPFDLADPKTYSKHDHVPTWPCWETCVASLMLVLLIYVTNDWYGVQEIVYGHRANISWGHEGARTVFRFEQLAWVSLLIGLIPIFFISSFRKRPRSLSTTVFTFVGMAIYLAWPGTWLWFQDLPGTLQQVHEWESYWEAWRNNLDPDEWWGLL